MAKNIIEVAPEKFPWLDLGRYSFSMGCEKDGMVFVAGQTASAYDKEKGHVLCKGDVVEQTKIAWEKIGVVLEAAGLSYDNVVKTVDYIDPTALPKYRQTGDVRKQYLGQSPAAATGIVVHDLLRPDALIEINAIAVKGKKEAIVPEGEEFKWYKSLTYAPGVKVGNKVWVSGTTGSEWDASGKKTYSPDTVRQMEVCYKQMDKVLTAAGAVPADVLYGVDYVPAQAALEYRHMDKIRRNYFKGTFPASADVVCNRLLAPRANLEVELTAVMGVPREEIRVPAWEKRYEQLTSAPGLKMGNLVYFSVQSAIDHTTGQSVTANYDVVAQGRKAYQNLAELCAEAGVTMDDILYTIEFIPPNAYEGYRGIAQVRKEFFGDRFPAATGIMMHQVQRSDLVIEVLAIAAV